MFQYKTIVIIFLLNGIIKNSNENRNDLRSLLTDSSSINYYLLNTSNYDQLEIFTYYNRNISINNITNVTNPNEHIIVINKNSSNYSINDGIFIDYKNKLQNPKHLKFSYFINYTSDKIFDEDNDKYEACNLRLTNYTINQLLNSTYKTNHSDPLFFRIRSNTSLTINDKSFYLDKEKYNFKRLDFTNIDLILNWEDQNILLFYNSELVDDTLSIHNLMTDFYHIDLEKNKTNPNSIILYNFYPNTLCYIKNLQICEDFCDEETKSKYRNKTSLNGTWNKINAIILIFICMLYDI